MEIIVSATPDRDAGQALSTLIHKYQGVPVLLLLSGGSALSLLEQVDVSVLDERVTLTTLDERFSLDAAVNNFSQIESTDFFKAARSRGVRVLSTKIDTTDTLQSAGERFVNNLKTWRSQNENGVIIATMGIGADGHIAGMFPGEYDVDFASDSWVVWYEVPPEINQYTKRITVTNTFLQTQVIEVILFATSTKARLLKPLMHVQTEQPQGPTAILKRLPSVTLYTDYNPDDGV